VPPIYLLVSFEWLLRIFGLSCNVSAVKFTSS
jgi:hypothetical protein